MKRSAAACAPSSDPRRRLPPPRGSFPCRRAMAMAGADATGEGLDRFNVTRYVSRTCTSEKEARRGQLAKPEPPRHWQAADHRPCHSALADRGAERAGGTARRGAQRALHEFWPSHKRRMRSVAAALLPEPLQLATPAGSQAGAPRGVTATAPGAGDQRRRGRVGVGAPLSEVRPTRPCPLARGPKHCKPRLRPPTDV